MFNGCPFPPFRFGGFCPVICGTVAWGDLGGMCESPGCLALPLRCSVESVKQLATPPPRARTLALSHTRARTPARTRTALVVCSHSGQCLATGHARRRPDQHPAHVRNVPSAVQPGGGAGRRGREGAGPPDRGHQEGAATLAEPFVFPGRCRARGLGGTRDSPGSTGISLQKNEDVAFCFPTACCWFGPEKEREFVVAKLEQGRKIQSLCSCSLVGHRTRVE